MNISQPVIFYDGVCGLCNRSIQFVIKRDPKRVFRYAALQSRFAQEKFSAHAQGDSFVLWHEGKCYTRSDAALKVLWLVGGFWKSSCVFRLIPACLRDCVYDWIARHRYAWFGKYERCPLPSAEQRTLFLD